MPLPPRIVNRPRLLPGLDFYYHVYSKLTTARGGMGDGFIPINVIWDFCDRNDITGYEQERLIEIVMSIDLAYIKYKQEESKIKAKSLQKGKQK